MENIKVVFFLQEEIGCIGSNACDLSFFDDCMFIGQADRKGNRDFINYSNGVKLFDDEFSKFVKPFLDTYDYKECGGIATDAGALSKRGVNIACFNISCGYYEPHSAREYVVISDVQVCYNIIHNIILNAKQRFTYVRPVPVYPTYNRTDPKSKLYTLLYDTFKKHPKYIKSNKMSYAYSLTIDFFVDLLESYDKLVDEVYPEYPYITDQLEEFLELDNQEDDAPQSSQTTLFPNVTDCLHKNVRYDSSVAQYYCMDCFKYIDDADAFYDQETLNTYHSQKGYW